MVDCSESPGANGAAMKDRGPERRALNSETMYRIYTEVSRLQINATHSAANMQ